MTQTIIQILLLIVSGIAVFTIIMPKFEEIAVIQSETEEYDQAIESAFATNERLSALTQQASSFSQQEQHKLDRLVPFNIDTLSLGYDIEGLIDRHGLFLNGIDIAEPTVLRDPVQTSAPSEAGPASAPIEKEIEQQEITITLSGTYEQFKGFLADIETSAQLLEVVELLYSSTGSDLSQFSLTVMAYGLQPRE